MLVTADLIGTGMTLRSYPQFSIGEDALLGEDGGNLKEFELDSDGVLTSVSDDPWIYYAFGEPVNVRFITAEVSGVSGPESEAQFYLMPSAGYRSAKLADGQISARFGRAQGCVGVGGIRLDLATAEGVSLSVDQVVVNSRGAVILDVQRLMAVGLFGLSLVLAELLGWFRLILDRREAAAAEGKRQRLAFLIIPAGVQAGLKIVLLFLLRKQLMNNDGIGRQYLLCWMAVLGLEFLCIAALHLGAGKYRTNIWLCFGLTVPFSVLQFALAELLNLVTFDFQTFEYLAMNLLLCALVPSVLLLLLRSGAFALTISSMVMTALTVANHYYGMLRDNPLEYFDIANARTAVNVVGNYALALDGPAAAALLALPVLGVVLFTALGVKGCGWKLRTFLGNLALVAAAAVIFAANIPTFGNFSNLQIISSEKGYLLSFASFIKMGQVKRPEGYTAGLADEILAGAEGRSKKEEFPADSERSAPNIIVIMDEAFADLPELYGFETTEDALPNIHALKENTIRGRMLASVYGGGTANTEYEFLTGNSLHFLPMGSSPYVQYVGSHQQSLAWRLRNLGYSSAAYHPYLAISYRRTEAYPLLGLEPFYSIADELPYEDCLRSYISDESDFNNVIYLYEQRDQGQPFFLFNVTMQNHGGYSVDEPALEVTVRPVSEKLQSAALLEYLALIHETDAAFQKLVDYFSQVEEDTVILLFGDHQPSMDSETNNALDQIGLERNGELDSERRYYSTFVMWANFDIDEQEEFVTSPNYLRPLLLWQAGIELNAYERFLLELREEYPAMNAFGCLDSRGEWHSREENPGGTLGQYRYLIYNNVFDKKNLELEYYE